MTARIVLLHSPLLGPAAWSKAAAKIVQAGLLVETPAWLPLSTIGQDFYAALADSLASTLPDDEPVVLVAHSGAGALIPALVARARGPVAGAIFADAILPHPGRSWFDTAPPSLREQLRAGAERGQLPPWDAWWPPGALARLVPDPRLLATVTAELEPVPLAYFEEAAPTVALDSPTAYLQLSGAYQDESRLAAGYGWPVTRLPLHHLAMLTHPQAVADAIIALATALEAAAHG